MGLPGQNRAERCAEIISLGWGRESRVSWTNAENTSPARDRHWFCPQPLWFRIRSYWIWSIQNAGRGTWEFPSILPSLTTRLLYKTLVWGGSRHSHCKYKGSQWNFAAIPGFSLDYRGCGAQLHRAATQSMCEGWAQLQGTLRVQVLPGLGRHGIRSPLNHNFGLCCLYCTYVHT